jgi:hypothetical protein
VQLVKRLWICYKAVCIRNLRFFVQCIGALSVLNPPQNVLSTNTISVGRVGQPSWEHILGLKGPHKLKYYYWIYFILRIIVGQTFRAVDSSVRGLHLTISILLQYEAFVGAFAKLRKATIIFVMSVRLSASNNSVPSGKFLYNLVFENFSKICGENSSVIKIGQ